MVKNHTANVSNFVSPIFIQRPILAVESWTVEEEIVFERSSVTQGT